MNTVSQNNPSAPSSSPSLFYASNTNVFTFVWGFDNLPDDFYNKWVDHFLYITTVNDGLVVDVHYWYMPGQKPMHGNSLRLRLRRRSTSLSPVSTAVSIPALRRYAARLVRPML
jgi:hypothetical protein